MQYKNPDIEKIISVNMRLSVAHTRNDNLSYAVSVKKKHP